MFGKRLSKNVWAKKENFLEWHAQTMFEFEPSIYKNNFFFFHWFSLLSHNPTRVMAFHTYVTPAIIVNMSCFLLLHCATDCSTIAWIELLLLSSYNRLFPFNDGPSGSINPGNNSTIASVCEIYAKWHVSNLAPTQAWPLHSPSIYCKNERKIGKKLWLTIGHGEEEINWEPIRREKLMTKLTQKNAACKEGKRYTE